MHTYFRQMMTIPTFFTSALVLVQTFFLTVFFLGSFTTILHAEQTSNPPTPKVGKPHPWRPPFGLDRVGYFESEADFEAAAKASVTDPANPVDLGLIFVPEGWLVLTQGQRPIVEVAVFSRHEARNDTKLRLWFASDPKQVWEQALALPPGKVVRTKMQIESPAFNRDRDQLHVAIVDSKGETVWKQEITTMLVRQHPQLPKFGATKLKLRYDMPIVVNHSENAEVDVKKLTYLDYDKGWDAALEDVVVSLPNGSRFVFWRGASYIPFWAGPNGTGVCYEWAETTPPPGAFADSIEPLMDKELRFGRVEVVESTVSRVHVRWTYQSVSFKYEVFGDQTVEDFYFYPDGFGVRSVRIKKRVDAEYELTEFIVLSPPGAYPLGFLPRNAVKMLYLDGTERAFEFPGKTPGAIMYKPDRFEPVIYQIQGHRKDRSRAIYFHPSDGHFPKFQYGPFFDQEQLVTPAYWGGHWPLARGKPTGAKIDGLLGLTPGHTSLMTWAMGNEPDAITKGFVRTINARGESVRMSVEQYAWLIGMTEEPAARLVQRARSFIHPPTVEAKGGTLEWQAYAADRGAICLRAEGQLLELKIKPVEVTVNPVFEISNVRGPIKRLMLAGKVLDPKRYAWDDHTLWVNHTFTQPQMVTVEFQDHPIK